MEVENHVLLCFHQNKSIKREKRCSGRESWRVHHPVDVSLSGRLLLFFFNWLIQVSTQCLFLYLSALLFIHDYWGEIIGLYNPTTSTAFCLFFSHFPNIFLFIRLFPAFHGFCWIDPARISLIGFCSSSLIIADKPSKSIFRLPREWRGMKGDTTRSKFLSHFIVVSMSHFIP